MTITTEEAEWLAKQHDLVRFTLGMKAPEHDLTAATIRSLAAERDALKADNARLRETLLLARIAVSHASELSDRILYTQDLAKIDAALGETQ